MNEKPTIVNGEETGKTTVSGNNVHAADGTFTKKNETSSKEIEDSTPQKQNFTWKNDHRHFYNPYSEEDSNEEIEQKREGHLSEKSTFYTRKGQHTSSGDKRQEFLDSGITNFNHLDKEQKLKAIDCFISMPCVMDNLKQLVDYKIFQDCFEPNDPTGKLDMDGVDLVIKSKIFADRFAAGRVAVDVKTSTKTMFDPSKNNDDLTFSFSIADQKKSRTEEGLAKRVERGFFGINNLTDYYLYYIPSISLDPSLIYQAVTKGKYEVNKDTFGKNEMFFIDKKRMRKNIINDFFGDYNSLQEWLDFCYDALNVNGLKNKKVKEVINQFGWKVNEKSNMIVKDFNDGKGNVLKVSAIKNENGFKFDIHPSKKLLLYYYKTDKKSVQYFDFSNGHDENYYKEQENYLASEYNIWI